MPGEPAVKIYTTPGCGRCLAVKHFLDERGVAFNEIPVEGNFSGLREMVRLSKSKQVPVTALGDAFVIGFDPEALTLAYPLAAEGTVADGSTVEIHWVQARLRCRACGVESMTDDPIILCTACGSDQVDLTAGRELHLASAELE